MAPKLLAFHADQPDYKEYCDPAYLQNPSAFPDSESITQTNPCFHVFNSQPAQLQPEPKTPLLKGITEQAGKRRKGKQFAAKPAVYHILSVRMR